MSAVKKWTLTEPWLKIDCGLGEAPFWEQRTNTLRFVDIIRSKVHAVELDEGPSSQRELASLDISIGTTADVEGNDGEFIFGGKHGYGLLNRKTGRYAYIKRVWDETELKEGKDKRMRGNDGAVDSQGRYWVGYMNDPLVMSPTPEGTLYRLDPDLTLHRMIEGVTIPNGISWSKDDQTMFFTDSPGKTIDMFDYDAVTGNISNRRPFFRVEDGDGVPDGHCLDEEGHMWAAVFGSGKVVRISPGGKVVAEIHLPTRCVTCPAFVGEDLVITTAEEEEPARFPESVRLQGSVFRCHVGVRGQQLNRFRHQAGGGGRQRLERP